MDQLKGKKVLIAWGLKDMAFKQPELDRWAQTFPDARIVRSEDAGHFVAEEKPDELAREIQEFIGS